MNGRPSSATWSATRNPHIFCVDPLCLRGSAYAELQPRHVAILANATSTESLAVAQHYAAKRGVPANHIVRLDLPLRDTLTRPEYEELLVAPLRRALEERNLASSIRVIVTTYGVPLRIEAPTLTHDEKTWLAEAQSLVKTSRARLDQLKSAFQQMTPDSPKSDNLTNVPAQEILEIARTVTFLPRVDQAWRAAVQHIRQLPQPESERALQKLLQLTQQYRGWGILLQKEAGTGRPGFSIDNPTMAAWRKLLEQTSPYWAGFGREPIRSQRRLIYRWAKQLFGLRGVLELASAEVDLLTYTYADASLDSELSLLWWERNLYPVAWSWANPFFQDSAVNPDDLPILMVSRLDGPTAELAKGLVDQALQAECSGLQGTMYFDTRGLKPKDATDAYGIYDQSLRDAAEVVKHRSLYNVVLDNAEATLSRPGSAPDVALYIGWYKLRAYENAFTFKPGAIGYHMASAETLSVHDPGETGWCKNALERGITATLGSVGEPYLDAFPEPARFTQLLLTGKYSLIEVYYMTSRYVSWRMALFGDPLYNPLRGRSRPAANSALSLPASPSERPFGAPPARLAQKHRKQKDQMAALVKLLLDAEPGNATPSR